MSEVEQKAKDDLRPYTSADDERLFLMCGLMARENFLE